MIRIKFETMEDAMKGLLHDYARSLINIEMYMLHLDEEDISPKMLEERDALKAKVEALTPEWFPEELEDAALQEAEEMPGWVSHTDILIQSLIEGRWKPASPSFSDEWEAILF